MGKSLNIIKKMATIGIITEKNKSSVCFQSLRKEDLYKKGKKGININFIFFIGSILFINSKKIKIHNTLQYYNLNLELIFNKSATNIVIMKIVEYQNNKTKWQ
jgi:hypothetical protein